MYLFRSDTVLLFACHLSSTSGEAIAWFKVEFRQICQARLLTNESESGKYVYAHAR